MDTDKNGLSVRTLQETDIENIVHYWLSAEDAFLTGMGVDLQKIPVMEQLAQTLLGQLTTPIEQKKAYCIIWELNHQPVGHCNTNPITFGEEAFMHLHLWDRISRKRGLGAASLKMTLPYFFNDLKLKRLYSEPYALNPAPNRTLEKVGFEFEKEYVTIPGSLSFEQPVKRWRLTREKFRQLYS